MEKTVQITIASMQFQVTESAYSTLRAYLDRLGAHFGNSADGNEIMRDIESRIAEKFIDAKHKLVTDRDVNAVVAEIGEVSAFSDDEDSDVPPHSDRARSHEQSTRKRLFRDMDNAYLGGVSSGIAAYFSIDPLWIRLAFLVSIFFGGTGIVLYLILWFLIPEAKHASQKLEMNGRPVNLDTIAGVVKDRFEEAEKSGVFRRSAHVIDVIVRRLFRYIGIVVGAVLTIESFLAIIAATVLAGIVLLNWDSPWNDFPHKELISPALLWAAIITAYTVVIVPLIFILTLGVRWMLKRSILTATVGFGLVGIWALALVSGGVLATKIGGDYYAYTAAAPEYARTVEERPVAAFNSIIVERAHVSVVHGPEFMVRIEGRAMDMNNVSVESMDGHLTLRSLSRKEASCLFCHTRTPSVTVTVPTLEALSVVSGSADLELEVERISIDAKSGSVRGELSAHETVFSLQSSNLNLDLTSASTSVVTQSSFARLEGTGTDLYVTSRSSTVDADSFRTTSARVDSTSSFVAVNSTDPVTIIHSKSSTIQNAGTGAGASHAIEAIEEIEEIEI